MRRTPTRSARLAAAGLLAAALAAPARAGDRPPDRHALAFAVSGGVSLGAYEAGFLHYGLAAVRANPGLVDLRLVTGASAGSVNGVLAVLAACGEPWATPGDGLFWRTWIPLGLESLTAEPPTALAALTRRPLLAAADEIRAAWDRGLDDRCDVVLGAAVTRVEPRAVTRAGGRLSLPRLEEKLALHVRGRGPGRPPQVRNYTDPYYSVPQILLPEGADGEVSFESLRALLLASTAFPIAFEPVSLAHCDYVAGDPDETCPAERAREALFVDGGVLDNAPLRLAARLAGAGLGDDGKGGTAWASRPMMGAIHLPDAALFAYVSPDVVAFPEVAPRDEGPPGSLGPLVARLAQGFVRGARAKELLTLLEEYPEIHDRLLVPARHFPAAGSPLLAFLGFLEQEFRVFDFYLGMYDARRLFSETVAPGLAGEGRPPLVFPEPPFERERGAAVVGGWRPLACLRGVFDGVPALAAACDDPALGDFRILLQTSLERLYAACARREGEAGAPTTHPHCAAAREGAEPPRVPGVATAGTVEWRRRRGEGETPHALRLLAGHRFRFEDLGLERGEADQALRIFRKRAGALAMELAWAQPAPPERGMVAVAGALALNALAYAPPAHIVWATLGRDLELGWSRELPTPRALPDTRLQLALLAVRFSDAMSSDPQRIAFSGAAGLELVPPGLSGYRLQTSLAVRAGILASLEDDLGSRPCAAPDTIGRCSGPFVQAVVMVTAIERLRLQLAWEYHLPVNRRPGGLWAVTPGLGFQITF